SLRRARPPHFPEPSRRFRRPFAQSKACRETVPRGTPTSNRRARCAAPAARPRTCSGITLMQHRQTRLAAALIALPFALPVAAAEETTLAPQVVTAAPMSEPLTVVTDPRAPRQPIPALDGADILKTIPGFSVIRKGGTSGDPVFRGMAGSRLNILLDGENILGGCGGRMDPPTAYVFPESYDRMTVLKGPQTVIHGPGNSAGTVLFERSRERASEAGGAVDASITAGSFQRLDLMGEGRYATPDFYVRGTATRT